MPALKRGSVCVTSFSQHVVPKVSSPQDSDDPDIAPDRSKKWRIRFVIFGLLAVATGLLGLHTPDLLGYVCLAISLICVAFAANAFLES